jgi:hypothetical protein
MGPAREGGLCQDTTVIQQKPSMLSLTLMGLRLATESFTRWQRTYYKQLTEKVSHYVGEVTGILKTWLILRWRDNMAGDTIKDQIDKIARSESFWQKYTLQIITLVFLAGGGWTMLDNVTAAAQENKEQIEVVKDREVEIEKKLIKIEITQQHIVEEVVKQDTKLDKILEQLSKIEKKEE